MFDDDTGATCIPWARLRFSIIGPLLSAPPQDGSARDSPRCTLSTETPQRARRNLR